MEWEEAMEQARENLGYTSGQYVQDWDELVQEAKNILAQWRREWLDKRRQAYHEYLGSEEWKEKREIVLERDEYCVDCGDHHGKSIMKVIGGFILKMKLKIVLAFVVSAIKQGTARQGEARNKI